MHKSKPSLSARARKKVTKEIRAAEHSANPPAPERTTTKKATQAKKTRKERKASPQHVKTEGARWAQEKTKKLLDARKVESKKSAKRK